MQQQSFTTTVQQQGSRIFLALPFDPEAVWGTKGRHHVRGTVNAIPIRGSLGSDGNVYFLLLGAAWRRDSHIQPGMTVDVSLAPEGPQQASLAPDVAEALAQAPTAAAFFNDLATFYRNNYVKWVEGANRVETRAARIAELITLLNAGQKQR